LSLYFANFIVPSQGLPGINGFPGLSGERVSISYKTVISYTYVDNLSEK